MFFLLGIEYLGIEYTDFPVNWLLLAQEENGFQIEFEDQESETENQQADQSTQKQGEIPVNSAGVDEDGEEKQAQQTSTENSERISTGSSSISVGEQNQSRKETSGEQQSYQENSRQETADKEKTGKAEEKTNPYGNTPVFTPYVILGSEDVSGITYQKVGLLGELAFDSLGFPLGIGLNIVIRFNEDGIRKEDWDFSELKTYTNAIRYIRWGRKGIPPFYARIGYLSNVFLGNGVLVRRYTNISNADIQHKVNRVGFESWLELRKGPFSGGFEFFTNSVHPVSWTDVSYTTEPLTVYIPSLGVNGTVELNVEERLTRKDAPFRVIGFRAFVNPLYPFFREGVLSKLELGASCVVDRAPATILTGNKTYAENSGDHYVVVKNVVYESGGNPLYAWGFDWSLPFGVGPVNIRIYSEADYMHVPIWNVPASEKWGIVPIGFVADLPMGFSFSADYRNFGAGFVPYIFDSSYESSRLEGIESGSRRYGFYSALSWAGLRFLKVSLGYQHMFDAGGDLYDALEGRITVDTSNTTTFSSLPVYLQNIKNLEVFYYQRDIDWGLEWWKSLNTRFGASLIYSMGGADLKVSFLGYFDYNLKGELVLKTSFDVSTEIGF